MRARTIMLQGTGSNVGKSVLAAALCRIFYQDGFKVAPFKSQNMALNSFVTKDGKEISRAQVVQAEAAAVEPAVEMNPILLKPAGNMKSQVIVMGRPLSNMSAQEYHNHYVQRAREVICRSLEKLKSNYEIVVIEGAGSPVEINLKENEVVNMRVAKWADAPVLLVVDIDRGGALAWVVGTLELLTPEERERVAGIIINKFRGDVKLLKPALDFLEKRTGKPVLGVVPYFQGFRVPEEDSQGRQLARKEKRSTEELEIVVLRLPCISNFTDFDPLEEEPDTFVRYVEAEESIGRPDAVIIPGSKNSAEDLNYLEETGLADEIFSLAGKGTPVVGICGGYQMLGMEISDPYQVESERGSVKGLCLLPLVTTLAKRKSTHQAKAKVAAREGFLAPLNGEEVCGYEIHMGKTRLLNGARPLLRLFERSGKEVQEWDGAVSGDGNIFGTYLHGIFDNDVFRRSWLNYLRQRKGLPPLALDRGIRAREIKERDYNLLADTVRKSIKLNEIYRIMGLL